MSKRPACVEMGCRVIPLAVEADGHTRCLMQSHELDALDRLDKLERRLGTGRLA